MVKVNVNNDESKVILHLKGWTKWGKQEGLEKLYEEQYRHHEIDVRGVYAMVSEIFWKLWAARGSHITELEEVLNNELPSEAWKVGGKKFGLWYNPDTDKLNNEELLWARILSMGSYISYTEVKYINNIYPKGIDACK